MGFLLLLGYIFIVFIILSFCKAASIGDKQIEKIEDNYNEHERSN